MDIKQTILDFIAKDKKLLNRQPLHLHLSDQEVKRKLLLLEERHTIAIQTILNILLSMHKDTNQTEK